MSEQGEKCWHNNMRRLQDRGEYGSSNATDWFWCPDCGAIGEDDRYPEGPSRWQVPAELEQLRPRAALASDLAGALLELRGWINGMSPFLRSHGIRPSQDEIKTGQRHTELLAEYDALPPSQGEGA